ncbi:MAG: metalloregulator ArsR/SmtB family transcription factor [Gammaproteobacteria bacterium]
MDVEPTDAMVSRISAAIAEPARTRMLYCLMDGRARTSTELGIVAEVSPSTASVHLARLKEQQLVEVVTQGKYRYYSLAGESVAAVLEALAVMAGGTRDRFVPSTPATLRAARTCYDHMAGTLAVALHDRFLKTRWLSTPTPDNGVYDVTPEGMRALAALGMDVEALRSQRRHFAYACLDWSERRSHIAGALGAALLKTALRRKWVVQGLVSRELRVTPAGKRAILAVFGVQVSS